MSGSAVIVSLRVPAAPERAFDAFTRNIGDWWRPNSLFRIVRSGDGRMDFEPGVGGRLLMHLADGGTFTVGHISVWEPGVRLVMGWRHDSFAEDQCTELEVRFEPVGAETRVTVEHRGWDAIPQAHAARHGFPLMLFQQRAAEYWQRLLASLKDTLA